MKTARHCAASLLIFNLCQASVLAGNGLSPANHSTVILMYHHVSSSTPPSTSIAPEDFAEHMKYVNTHFNVIPLQQAITSLTEGTPLASNTLVITFDDGYRNILENGHPVLTSLGFPYTIFINPDRIGVEAMQLSWDEVKQMQQEGVTFANHTLDHIHLLDRTAGETQAQWLERVWANIDDAQQLLQAKLGDVPKWLAYPFGEYNAALAEKLLNEGYIAFGQHSGPVSGHSHFAALSRFPAAGIYANLSSLKTKMHSLAMPVIAATPVDPQRSPGDKLAFSFAFESGDLRATQLQCFYRGEAIEHTIADGRLQVTADILLPVGRSRVNCTAPSVSLKGRYYWYSQPFFVPDASGRFPN